jgi:hypothetical protein
VRGRPEQGPHRERQAVGAQIAHHGPRALEFAELGEDEPEARLDLFVRVQDDRARAVMGQSSREGQAQLAPCRFLALALVEAHPDLMQLRLAHDAGQAQEQAVVVGAGIVEPLAIGDEHPEQGAQLEQLMPVAVVAREPGGIQADDQAGVAEPDLGDELLEAGPFGAARARFAEILVDDVDPLARPAEPDGTVDQAVLEFGALVMIPDLIDRGLTHVDVGEPGAVGRAQPLVRSVRGGQHAGSPRSRDGSPACVAAARRERGRSALASRPAGSARAAAGAPELEWTLETQHDAGAVGWWPSRITSSAEAASVAVKWRANGSRVRALTRGRSEGGGGETDGGVPRSVADRRTERRRPSPSSTTTKAGLRAEWSDTSDSRCPERA